MSHCFGVDKAPTADIRILQRRRRVSRVIKLSTFTTQVAVVASHSAELTSELNFTREESCIDLQQI